MNHEHDRKQIIAANPLLDYCQAQGWQLKKDGPRWKCLCPLHNEDNTELHYQSREKPLELFWLRYRRQRHRPSRQIAGYLDRRGDAGIIARRFRNGSTESSATQALPGKESVATPKPSLRGNQPEKPARVCAYDYQDATGKVVFQVVRYEPKDFKQCRIVDGKRVWNMDGVERLPYRLPELLCHPTSVWIVEGEKDVETLRASDQTATCNPGGTGKWLPAFSQYLRGKCVYIVADNDEPGQKHGREVLKSLEGIVEWVKWIELPKEHNGRPIKDITDLRSHCRGEDFLDVLADLQDKARLIDKGVDIEAYTMAELEQQYITEIESFSEVSLSLGNWLPGLNIRPLIPGDVLGIIAGTGQLKSAAAQNILACNPHMPALFCQLEISGPLMFERGAAIATGIDTTEVHHRYRRSRPGRLALGRKDEQPSGLDPQHEHEADRRTYLSFIGQTGKRASRCCYRLYPAHQGRRHPV